MIELPIFIAQPNVQHQPPLTGASRRCSFDDQTTFGLRNQGAGEGSAACTCSAIGSLRSNRCPMTNLSRLRPPVFCSLLVDHIHSFTAVHSPLRISSCSVFNPHHDFLMIRGLSSNDLSSSTDRNVSPANPATITIPNSMQIDLIVIFFMLGGVD